MEYMFSNEYFSTYGIDLYSSWLEYCKVTITAAIDGFCRHFRQELQYHLILIQIDTN